MLREVKGEEDLYREFLGESDDAVLWPGRPVWVNILGQTREKLENYVDSAVLLGAEEKDLSGENAEIRWLTEFSGEYAQRNNESPDLEIGMALGSTYRAICSEHDLNCFETHNGVLEETAEKVANDTSHLDPDRVIYNLESINKEEIAQTLTAKLEERGYSAEYAMNDSSGHGGADFTESHVWGEK